MYAGTGRGLMCGGVVECDVTVTRYIHVNCIVYNVHDKIHSANILSSQFS